MFLESQQFLLDTFLLLAHGKGVRTILSECLSQHVRSLVDRSAIHILREVVVNTHRCGIVHITRHDGLLSQERSHIVVLHPEQRIPDGSITEIILTTHNRTKGNHLGVERGRSLIIVGTLLQIVTLYLSRGDITVVNADSSVVGTLIINMVVIDERLGFDTGRIGEHLITVSTILVSTNLSCEHQLEQIGEEVHLCADGLYRIIETGIGILGKINLTIDVTPPNHVLRHALCRWE